MGLSATEGHNTLRNDTCDDSGGNRQSVTYYVDDTDTHQFTETSGSLNIIKGEDSKT